jgi:hypothetical protein
MMTAAPPSVPPPSLAQDVERSQSLPELVFTANNSRHAHVLYVGCPHPHVPVRPLRPPILIVAGVQKGGTSSMRSLLPQRRLCHSATGELNFFNHECFARRPVEPGELDGYLGEWRSCHGQGAFDKSPATYIQPWIPLRVCQSLRPRPKIFFLLRNPIERAWSGYYYCQEMHEFRPPRLVRREGTTTSSVVSDFHDLAWLEVDITNRCSPFGTGDPSIDLALGVAFADCCAGVAREHGIVTPWPGCFNTPGCANTTVVAPHRRKQVHLGGAFGQWCYTHVRAGLYETHLKLWYRHHRPEDVLLARSEDFFYDESMIIDHLMAHLLGRNRPGGLNRSSTVKGATSTGAHMHTMRNDTRAMLQAFYAPFNARLEKLVGQKFRWW